MKKQISSPEKTNFLTKITKSYIFVFAAVFFVTVSVLFSSCSKKIDDRKNQTLKDFVFQEILYSECGKAELENPEKYYFSPNLKNFFLRNNVTSHGFLFEIELKNPEYAGIIESSQLFNEYSENGEWLESLFDASQTDFSAFEDGFDFPRPYSVSGEKGNEEIDTETSNSLWISSNKRLSFMKFKEEIFVPVQKEDSYILINSSPNATIRSFYNKDFLIEKKETWKISTPKNSEILQSEIYNYDEEKNISSIEITSKNSKIITYYKEKNPVRTDQYVFSENGEYLKTRTLWQYAANGKISIEEVTEYFYNDSDFTRFTDKFTKRQSYIYHEDEDIPPDYKYFENGQLKMRIDYQSKNTYVSQVIFNENYSVTTYYEDNVRKRDVYTMNGKTGRVKEYE